jgi:hypothetical protein
MNLKCVVGMHEWSGCKCSKCGKARDEGHDWLADCEQCAKCGKTRSGAHSWSGCKCSKCGKTRGEGHDWSKDCESCAKCGNKRAGAHAWDRCKCEKCPKTRNERHTWVGRECSVCGQQPTDLRPGEIVPITGHYECIPCREEAEASTHDDYASAWLRGDLRSQVMAAARVVEMTTRLEFTAGAVFDQCPKCGSSTKWRLD